MAQIKTPWPMLGDLGGQRPRPLSAPAVGSIGHVGVVTRLMAVALAPFLTPGPVAPSDPPVLLGILAWARREIQRDFFNRTPQAVADTVTTSEDTTVSGNILSNDDEPDYRDIKTVASHTDPEHGDLTVDVDGTFTYTPDAGYNGTDSFKYTVTDETSPSHVHGLTGLLAGGGHLNPREATVTVNVGSVNDAPNAVDDTTVNEDSPAITGNVRTNDDPDDNPADGDPDHHHHRQGHAELLTDGSYTYAPATNVNGIDTFTYTVSDGNPRPDTADVT